MSYFKKQRIQGEDKNGNAVDILGTTANELYTSDSYILHSILKELKINNSYLRQILGDEITEDDIEN